MPDTGGCGSVFLWRRCNTARTSGFVYDVMFACNRPGRGDASREFIQSGLPLAAPDRGRVWARFTKYLTTIL